jgi:hypothetical protein
MDRVPQVVCETLRAAGQPLDEGVRSVLGPRFGHDFSRVRVHADSGAHRSAREVGADAFAAGEHVVLGANVSPRPRDGRELTLMAHELAHTVQRPAAPLMDTPLQIGNSHSQIEHEANHAAAAALAGRPVQLAPAGGPPAIHRGWLGAIGGALLGGLGGAALGSFLGPIGAIAGGLLGALAGGFVGDALSESGRPLSSTERKEAECVFGNSINWDKVRLTDAAPVMGSMNNARTPFETVYFPPGTLAQGDAPYHWLIHELTHVWQSQHGISVVSKVFTAIRGGISKSVYSYGGDAELVKAATEKKSFKSFNTEQQGDIMQDYYLRLKGLQAGPLDPFLPFVAEVRGSAPVASC